VNGGDMGRVWFATEERVRSIWRLWACDDVGQLRRTPAGIFFQGRSHRVPMTAIRGLSLVRQRVEWGVWSVLGLVLSLLLAVVRRCAGPGHGRAVLLAVPILAALGALLVAASWRVGRWVRVEYTGDEGEPRRAYFSAASPWRRIAGHTDRLYRALQAQAGPLGSPGRQRACPGAAPGAGTTPD